EKHTPVDYELVTRVYDTADAAFRKVWHEHHVTWSVLERLSIIMSGLGVTLPDGEMEELVRLHENMELEFRPDFVEGVHEAIKSLHGKYRLGVISDTIFSPGRALRQLLADEGLLDFFDVLIFSDEIGKSKPEPVMFYSACQRLGVQLDELVHIGDREHNDIAGPKNLGARAILCTAAIDRGSSKTKADAMFKNYQELPSLIEKLAS
ncbi:HAD-IA family hydrolase, partial [candidate division KSB1 bacterium]|nr:HAD-IA family hydrolase [candidate division KSB1 bacterium]